MLLKETQLHPTSQVVTRFPGFSLPRPHTGSQLLPKRLHGSVNIWLKTIEPYTSDSIVSRSPRPIKAMKVLIGRTLSSLKRSNCYSQLTYFILTSLLVTRSIRPPLCIHKGSESYKCKARDETTFTQLWLTK